MRFCEDGRRQSTPGRDCHQAGEISYGLHKQNIYWEKLPIINFVTDIRLVGTGLDGRRSSTCSSTRTTEPFSPGADANTNKMQLVPQMLQNPPFLAEDHRLLPHLLLPPRLLLDRLPRHLLPGLQCCLDIIAKLFFEL